MTATCQQDWKSCIHLACHALTTVLAFRPLRVYSSPAHPIPQDRRFRLEVIPKQRTAIAHLLQLRLGVQRAPLVLGLLRIPSVNAREQKLEREGGDHARGRKRQRRAETRGVLWRFILLEDEGAYDAAEIADADHRRDAVFLSVDFEWEDGVKLTLRLSSRARRGC